MKPIRTMKAYVCGYCGHDDLSQDANAYWNFENQEMELGSTFDQEWCSECDGETSSVELTVHEFPNLILVVPGNAFYQDLPKKHKYVGFTPDQAVEKFVEDFFVNNLVEE